MKTDNPTGTFGIELSWNTGANYTATGNAALLTVDDRYWPFGATNNLWGRAAWTPAELRDATFRVSLTKQGINGSPMTDGVDHIRVRVTHTAVALNRAIIGLSGSARIELSASAIELTGFPMGSAIYIDGVATSTIDTNWHHVVITTPSDVAVTDLRARARQRLPVPLEWRDRRS